MTWWSGPFLKNSYADRCILGERTLLQILGRLRKMGRRVVFTNGCFDLLHVGHLRLLERAKSLGDVLVVGLNSDASVRRLKGPGRPVVLENDRARLLAALKPVDYVTIFQEETPERLIARVKPHVLVKGSDWPGHTIVGRAHAQRVVRVPLVPGRSTSHLIKTIWSKHR